MFIWHCFAKTHCRSQTSVWYLINEKQKGLQHLDISSPLKLWSVTLVVCGIWQIAEAHYLLLACRPTRCKCVFCHSYTKNLARWTDSRRLLWSVASGLGFPWRPCDWCCVFFLPSLLGVVFIMGCQSSLLMTIMGCQRGREGAVSP